MAWTGPIQDVEFSAAASGTTLTFSSTATIPIGTLIVIPWLVNGIVTLSTCADNSSQAGTANSYVLYSGIGDASISGSMVAVVVTRSILSTDVITLTLGSAATRRNGRLITFTGVVQGVTSFPNALDVGTTFTPAATNPITIGPTGSGITAIGELALGISYWIGGAVLSGKSDSTSGYTQGAVAAGSGGTTPRVEVNYSWRVLPGNGAETDTHSFTSITEAGGLISIWKSEAPTPHNTHSVRRVWAGT